MKLRNSISVFIAAGLCLALAACSHSRVIVVSLTNTSAQPLTEVMVDYPEATFGRNLLKPGDTYQYRIKATDSGPLKIAFTNAAGKSKNFSLATLHKNDEGTIEIKFTQEAAAADIKLNASR
jgi:hypothetical protein